MRHLMQVLRNLFGTNKKISWNDIATKNIEGNGMTLDNYLNNLFFFAVGETFRINEWYSGGMNANGYVYFTVPLPKNTSKVGGYSIITGTLTIYNSEGQRAYYQQNMKDISAENMISYFRPYYLTIGIKIDSSFSYQIKEYTPISIRLDSLNIQFN